MRTRTTVAIGLTLAVFSLFSQAVEAALVEAVQYPAWLERSGRSVPLTPGTPLQAADRVFTGDGARVLVTFPDGSTVKLGEKALFGVEKSEGGEVFRAALSVVTGAFRFTTDPAAKAQAREVTIRVRNLTAGIRGTDLWGRATDDTGMVCLLEGSITVASDGHPTLTLGGPLDSYERKRDTAPVVVKVSAAKAQEWAQETELQKEAAVGRIGGRWRVIAGVFASRAEAQGLNRMLRSEGYPSEVTGGGSGPFAVQITGLAGEIEARSLIGSLRSFRGVTLPSVMPMP